MRSQQTLAELMDPVVQSRMARYENSRIAVAKGYELAATLVTAASKREEFLVVARWIAVEYENDLNSTLERLEAEESKKIEVVKTPLIVTH